MAQHREIRNLALVGFMASGKTTVGRLVAQRLHYEFIDADALIESRLGQSISQVFSEKGEEWFRVYERQIVAEMSAFQRVVISTGGGMGANLANLASLKQHACVVYLWASPETIWSRARRHSHRPLLRDPNPLAKIRQLLAVRAPLYSTADVLVNTERRPLRRVAQLVIVEYHRMLGESQSK